MNSTEFRKTGIVKRNIQVYSNQYLHDIETNYYVCDALKTNNCLEYYLI